MRQQTIAGRSYKSPAQIGARLADLDKQFEGEDFTDEARAEWNDLNGVLEDLSEQEVRQARLVSVYRAGHTETLSDGVTYNRTQVRRSSGDARNAQTGALRTIERHVKEGRLGSTAADRVDEVLRGGDAEFGVDAAYVQAAGEDAYERAFAKLIRYGDGAILRMTGEEQEAVQRVNKAEEVRTALTVGSGAGGGFGLPISIDPTITLSSNGVINPIRKLADVRTMSTRELRLVTSDGVAAQYQAEGAEAVDNSPVLAQPDLIAQRATSFIPLSLEVDQDYPGLLHELGVLISDAKDVLEATKFLFGGGAGSSEPVGLLSIGTTGALTTSQRILSAGTAALALGDVYAIKQLIGDTRWAATAKWLVHPTRLDSVFRFVASGSTVEPQIMPEGRGGPLLGQPTAESSAMQTTLTTGSKWAVYGDLSAGYVIGDRLGASLELIPHLFGSGSRFPTGQRGAYAIWRNDGRVKVANALRYGETA